MKIVIIEDDLRIVEMIAMALYIRWPNIKVISTRFGEEGIEIVSNENPDAVVLDLGLPDIDGLLVLKAIRRYSDLPVLILTVRTIESDIVQGLELGADDYMVKPFKQLELLARLHGMIKRHQKSDDGEIISTGSIQLNTLTRILELGSKEIILTSTECRLMRHFIFNAGKIVTIQSLAEVLWGDNYLGAANAMRVYIRRLREKLEEDLKPPRFIITKPGIGYILIKNNIKMPNN
ncbi:response regulator transcription factor [Dehalococcoides mccartyi]|uniref:response regulator transcription factor n=1 Tax=Dehalococcoides mccartyi TaxID=61435 RepID=UPI00034D6A90|nr:response regulator transcription factor [Dehalococcoides mccartyi]